MIDYKNEVEEIANEVYSCFERARCELDYPISFPEDYSEYVFQKVIQQSNYDIEWLKNKNPEVFKTIKPKHILEIVIKKFKHYFIIGELKEHKNFVKVFNNNLLDYECSYNNVDKNDYLIKRFSKKIGFMSDKIYVIDF